MNKIRLINIIKKICQDKSIPTSITSKICECVKSHAVKMRVIKVIDDSLNLKHVKAYIIDFEGKIFIAGFLIEDTIYQFYITDLDNMFQLFEIVIDIISLLQKEGYYGFAFSDYEEMHIKDFIEEHETFKSKIDLDKHPIINMQDSPYESILEAIYKIGMKYSRDPFNRNIKLISGFFNAGKLEIILDHNRNCLETEVKILKDRFLKDYLI